MLRVRFAASGKEVVDLGLNEFEALGKSEGKSFLDLTWYLSRKVGCLPFRQSILRGSQGELHAMQSSSTDGETSVSS